MQASELQIFESIGALVVILDVEGRVVYWNSACTTLTGYDLEEIRGRPYWDFLLVPEELEAVKAGLAELVSTEHSSLLAHYWLTKGGERRWITWSNTSRLGSAGTTRYFIKTGLDQTERKQAEDARRVSEARLSGIIEIAADAIISIDEEQRIVLYNHGAETIFGWSAAEALGQPLSLLLPERHRAQHAQHARAFGQSAVATRRMGERIPTICGRRKSGDEFPAHAAISKLTVAGKTLFTVALRDITEEVQRARESRLLSELSALLMASFADENEALVSIARVTVQELADYCIVDLVGVDNAARRVRAFHRDASRAGLCAQLERLSLARRQLLPLPESAEATMPCLMSEVSPRYLESVAEDALGRAALRELDPGSLIAVPLTAGGELLGTLLLVRVSPARHYDETGLRLAQEIAGRAALAIENARLHQHARGAMRDQREANERMVAAAIRAHELADEAQQAKVLVEASERELRQVADFRELFIGIVGHDLRNPLSSIGLAASLLRKHGKLDDRDEKNVTRILNGSERMRRMISQLLDLTRARLGGGFPLDPKPADLRDVCRTVVEEFDVPIQVEIEGDVTGIWDADRLVELLSNLTGNAIDHAEPGTMLLLTAHPDGADVVIEVANHGEPIPAELLPVIFEPFRQARPGAKSASGNLGLGLYIAKQIVLSHGGSIDARARDGITTFVIRLPRCPPVDSRAPASDGLAGVGAREDGAE